jgi:hypothetical protein
MLRIASRIETTAGQTKTEIRKRCSLMVMKDQKSASTTSSLLKKIDALSVYFVEFAAGGIIKEKVYPIDC